MADRQGARAILLVHNDGIREVPARTFLATGSQGDEHTVTLRGPLESTCTCEAGRKGVRCYHVRAARLLVLRDREAVQR